MFSEDDKNPSSIKSGAGNSTFSHREPWLHEVKDKMKPMFAAAGGVYPDKIRVTCGFPHTGAFAEKKQSKGECWYEANSGDGHIEIMISPTVDDQMEVAGILAHELCHACVGPGIGHKGPFKALALKIGLEGKMTATTAGEAFKHVLRPILDGVGPYPHCEITKLKTARKKQGTRLLKLQCPMCEYTVRITQKWLDDVGAPRCPKDDDIMETDKAMPSEVGYFGEAEVEAEAEVEIDGEVAAAPDDEIAGAETGDEVCRGVPRGGNSEEARAFPWPQLPAPHEEDEH